MKNKNQRGILRKMVVILAIAGKDIGDSIRNKMVLSLLLGILTVIFSGHAMLLLGRIGSVPKAVVYDPSNATIVRRMTRSSAFRLFRAASLEDMEKEISDVPQEVRLGLVLPVDFAEKVDQGAPVTIDGYAVFWADEEETKQLADTFSDHFSQASGVPVSIDLHGSVIYPPAETAGFLFMVAATFVIMLFTTGGVLSPMLIMDERENKTLDALLVSPVNYGQVIAGKALVGLFYSSLGALVFFLIDGRLIIHPWVFLIAFLAGAMFCISLGLLFGTLFERADTLGIWMSVVFIVLIIPAMLSQRISTFAPDWIAKFISWMPTTGIYELTRLSMVGPVSTGDVVKYTAMITGVVIMLLAASVWQIRKRAWG